MTFVGELGWELYAPAEYGLRLWTSLLDAGRDSGLVTAGYRAIESLRLEKAYRVWSTDITPETNPYEAGLGFCVKLGKPGGFVGDEALRRAKAEGGAPAPRRAWCSTIPREAVLGGEPVLAGRRRCSGGSRPGGIGWSLGRLDRVRLPARRGRGRGHPGRGRAVRSPAARPPSPRRRCSTRTGCGYGAEAR